MLIMIAIRKPKHNTQTTTTATGELTVFNGAAPTELYVNRTHNEMSRRVSAKRSVLCKVCNVKKKLCSLPYSLVR